MLVQDSQNAHYGSISRHMEILKALISRHYCYLQPNLYLAIVMIVHVTECAE
jgi:hypothetical protein